MCNLRHNWGFNCVIKRRVGIVIFPLMCRKVLNLVMSMGHPASSAMVKSAEIGRKTMVVALPRRVKESEVVTSDFFTLQFQDKKCWLLDVNLADCAISHADDVESLGWGSEADAGWIEEQNFLLAR